MFIFSCVVPIFSRIELSAPVIVVCFSGVIKFLFFMKEYSIQDIFEPVSIIACFFLFWNCISMDKTWFFFLMLSNFVNNSFLFCPKLFSSCFLYWLIFSMWPICILSYQFFTKSICCSFSLFAISVNCFFSSRVCCPIFASNPVSLSFLHYHTVLHSVLFSHIYNTLYFPFHLSFLFVYLYFYIVPVSSICFVYLDYLVSYNYLFVIL